MKPKARGQTENRRDLAGAGGVPVRILGVDYGRKRIGLAVSDELGLTAQPLTTLTRINREKDLKNLREICREQGVRLIVVGYPLHLTGEVSEMAEEAARFARRVSKNLGIAVELLDERLTSWEAKQQSAQGSGARSEKPLDELAAAILLREYLEGTREKTLQPQQAEVR